MPFPFVMQGVLFLTGHQVAQGTVPLGGLLLFFLTIVVGGLCGSALVYWLSRFLGARLVNAFGRYVRLRPEKLEQAAQRFRSWLPLAVAVGRLSPGFLVPTSLVSGMGRVNYGLFALGVALSIVVWDGFFFALGLGLGRYLPSLGWTIFFLLLALALSILAGLGLARLYRSRVPPRKNT